MSEFVSFFQKTFLFKNISPDSIEKLLHNCDIEVKHFQKGEIIYSPDSFDRKLGFIYSGNCIVSRRSGDSAIPLNTAQELDSFGIVSVFSDRNEFPTLITAKNTCTVLFFSDKTVRRLINRCSQLSLNIIEFLTKKINFLNDKVAAFSGGCVEKKLASYIITAQRKNNSNVFDFNKKKSAEALNCGRASLYRAIESLENAGYISFESKKIIINDLKGLERIMK